MDVVVYFSLPIHTDHTKQHSFILFLLPISAALLDENVDPVGEHDGDHHQAREAGHEGEHAGVQLRVIRLAVVAILLSIPEHYRAGQGMSSYVSRTPTRQRRQ